MNFKQKLMTLAGIILMTCLKSAAPDLAPELPASSAAPVTHQSTGPVELPEKCVAEFRTLSLYIKLSTFDNKIRLTMPMNNASLTMPMREASTPVSNRIEDENINIILHAFNNYSEQIKPWLVEQRKANGSTDLHEHDLTKVFEILSRFCKSFNEFRAKNIPVLSISSLLLIYFHEYVAGCDTKLWKEWVNRIDSLLKEKESQLIASNIDKAII